MEPILLTCIFVIVLCVKYFKANSVYCPQCKQKREDEDVPLCGHCGWIFEIPGAEDDDYISGEENGQ